jgi:hypothetical protein
LWEKLKPDNVKDKEADKAEENKPEQQRTPD